MAPRHTETHQIVSQEDLDLLPYLIEPEPARRSPQRTPGTSYMQMHEFLRWMSPACEHRCASGCGRRAFDWSLEVLGQGLVDRHGREFSLDPADYLPRCRSCHQRLDAARRRSIRESNS